MKQKSTTFYCFSPPVMIATFAIEIVLFCYTLWRYKLSPITRLVALILVFLAGFQLAEFMVCEGSPNAAMQWSRFGFAAITMLPSLGLHLALTLTKVKRRARWLVLTYGAAGAFIGYFLLAAGSLSGHACTGNYVIFQLGEGSGWLYSLYYYGLLAAGLWVGWRGLQHERIKKLRRAIIGLMAGYAAFIVPTAAVNLVNPDTIRAIPSIMCGFAVLLALVLAFIVMPAAARRR